MNPITAQRGVLTLEDVLHPLDPSRADTSGKLHASGRAREGQCPRVASARHGLRDIRWMRRCIGPKTRYIPVSTISPTNTLAKPATIWATGCETCCPVDCWMTCWAEGVRWKEVKTRYSHGLHLSYGLLGQSMATIGFETIILAWTEIVHEDSERREMMSDNG